MAVTPTTNIKILKCPIELDNKNQLTFASVQEQFNYFNNLPYLEITDSYYQRKDSYIEYPAHIDTLIDYNYCMYQNENYTNKWFYAFITNMEYINDGTTRIYITTDVFQTWQFDITWKQSFVTREMISVSDDVPGRNLVPEGLETGEYKIIAKRDLDAMLRPIYIVAYTRNPKDDGFTQDTPDGQGVIANGIVNGMYFCICSVETIQGLLHTINSSGHGDAIMTVFTVPAFSLVGFNGWTLDNLQHSILWWFVDDFNADPLVVQLTGTPSSLDGYTPRNQKLRTFPYTYIGFNPPNGSQKVFRFEDFETGTVGFAFQSEINQNPTIAITPQNYRGISGDSTQDVVFLSGYPTIGWITDYYNTWLAQQSGIIDINMQQEQYNYIYNRSLTESQNQVNAITGLLGAFSSGMNKDYVGAASQGASAGYSYGTAQIRQEMADQNHEYYIQGQMAIKEQQKLLPNQGKLTGSNATLLGYNLLSKNIFCTYSIKSQFARRIDKYFDMYGYATNELKIPNTNNRPNWNYVKTEGANIIGTFNQEDLQTLKLIFDNGVTLWHNPSTFLDYSQNNR
jgi:hypothetical protein